MNAAFTKKEIFMRKEYDFSKGTRGKFLGKVDTKNPVIENENEPLDEVFKEELDFLDSNLARIEKLKSRLPELDAETREKLLKRISEAGKTLDKIVLQK